MPEKETTTMALKLHLPPQVPTQVQGTIDGAVPVLFQADRSVWRVAFGDWTHSVPAEAQRTSAAVRAFLYNAVAQYRTAHRPGIVA